MRVHWRIKVWKLMLGVGILAALLSTCIVPIGRQVEFSRLARHMDTSIRNLRPTYPALVNAAAWDCAHDWTITAYCNVCFSPEHVPTVQMYRLCEDIDRKLEGPIDLTTLIWIWDRLARTSPHGNRYVEKYRPEFKRCLPAIYLTKP